jgi:CBS domain containing-hemolysin-like protein
LEIERLFYLLFLVFLLILSAFFSGSEVALFGLDKKKINNYFSNNKIIQRYLNILLSSPRSLLITILIGNNLVNVAISIISVMVVTKIAINYKLDLSVMIAIQIVLLSTLILIFGELIPKLIATKYQISLLKLITIPLYYFSILIYPVTEIISELIRLSTSKIEFDRSKFAVSSEELADLSQLFENKINLHQSEKEIIESLTEFKDTLVFEIMTPRVDIVGLSIKDSIDSAIEIVNSSGHTRIPVYEKSIDNIVGILHAKDLLKFNINPKLKSGTNLKTLIKKPLFVPETKKINDLLREFQLKKNHIAIVVDEYGGTAGLITLEDIIEEVLGEIWDEFDRSELSINKIDHNSLVVNANVTFSDIESELKINIPIVEDQKDDSLAIFILNHLGEIPREGSNLEIEGLRITILEVAKKRIKRVRIELLNT